MIDRCLRGFKHRKHRAGRSHQTQSGAEANRNRSTTQYGRVNRSVQLTNIRAAGKDEAVRLTPPLKMTLESA